MSWRHEDTYCHSDSSERSSAKASVTNFHGIPSKNTKEKSKPGWEFRLETNKKSTKTGQNDKIKERRWNILEQKGKNNIGKITTCRNKPNSTGKKRKIKEISTKGKIIQTKQDISKQRK